MINQMKKPLLLSILMLITCLVMLIGTTFAWFSVSVSSGNNVIQAGNLDISVEYSLDGNTWKNLNGAKDLFQQGAWEPGHKEVVVLKVENKGTLSFKYKALLNIYEEIIGKTNTGEDIKLSDCLMVSTLVQQTNPNENNVVNLAFGNANSLTYEKTAKLSDFSEKEFLNKDAILTPGAFEYIIIEIHIPNDFGNRVNDNGVDIPQIKFGINILATQVPYEEDSFDNTYDLNAVHPTVIKINDSLYFAVEDSNVTNNTFFSNNTFTHPVVLDGDNTTVTMNVTSTDAVEWLDGRFPACGNVFGSANGSMITVEELIIEGVMMPNMAGYPTSNNTVFNTTLDKVKIEDAEIVGSLDGFSPALFSYGNTTLTDCEISGTKSSSGASVFDVVASNGVFTAYDSEIGSIFMDEETTIVDIRGDSKVDYIESVGNADERYILIRAGSVVEDIVADENTNIVIETGAVVKRINGVEVTGDNGNTFADVIIVSTQEEVNASIKNGDNLFVLNDIKLPKDTEYLFYAPKGKPIYVNGHGKTFTVAGTGTKPNESYDYGYLGFIPYNGEDAVVEDVRVVGSGFVEVGHYGESQYGTYTINRLVIENLIATLNINNGGNNVAGAFTHYGYATLTDCVMTGTTTLKTGFKPYDAVLVNSTKTYIVGGEYGIVYVAHQAYVEVGGGVEIDTIDSYAITKTKGKLVVKKDVKIGTINIFDYSNTYRANLNIEKGAQVGTIIYHSLTGIRTYTVEEWLAAYPDTEFKS